MSEFSELTPQEFSTKALLENSKPRDDSIKGPPSDLDPELTTGTRFDKNKLPDQMAFDKTRTEKVQVMENTPGKMVDKMRNPTGLN